LAQCGVNLDDRQLLRKSAQLLRTWFITPQTRMSPSARFAQCRPGDPEYNYRGLVEFRYLIYLPFVVPVLVGAEVLTLEEADEVKHWLRALKQECNASGTLSKALAANNNIGTWTAATFAAIDLFTGDERSAFEGVWQAPLRLGRQLLPLSVQIHEIGRTRALHYCLFNLAAWWWMDQVGKQFGMDLMDYKGVKGESIRQALEFCLSNRGTFSDYEASRQEFDARLEVMSTIFNEKSHVKTNLLTSDPDWGMPPVYVVASIGLCESIIPITGDEQVTSGTRLNWISVEALSGKGGG
jgi:hypothetical protein